MDRIAEIRERLEKATPGPWKIDTGIEYTCEIGDEIVYESFAIIRRTDNGAGICDIQFDDKEKGNADFIANARQDIPYLLSVIEEKQSRITMLSEDLETHEKVFHEQEAEIEQLKPLAELGRLAVEVFEEEFACRDCIVNGYNEKCMESCEWIKFCRKRAGMEV